MDGWNTAVLRSLFIFYDRANMCVNTQHTFRFTNRSLEGARVEKKTPGAKRNKCDITFLNFFIVINELVSAESELTQTPIL